MGQEGCTSGIGEANLPQKLSLISKQERESVGERNTGGDEGGPEER